LARTAASGSRASYLQTQHSQVLKPLDPGNICLILLALSRKALAFFFSFEIDLIQHQSCIELLKEKKVFFLILCFVSINQHVAY